MLTDALIAPQRGHLFPWVPVMLALGIGGYFALPAEPGPAGLAAAAALAVLGAAASLRAPEGIAPLVLGLALVAAGGALAAWRTQSVAAPVLSFRYYGPVEGRILEIDRSLSDRLRLTLDRVVLTGVAPERVPLRVRVSLPDDMPHAPLEPGLTVILTGHLSPPMGPAEPGGFDFRRHAWFEGLGAVGYTRLPVLALEPPARSRPALVVAGIRSHLSAAIRARIPGQPGAFAAAVVTGDRSGLERGTLDAMRASNLAHLLAISGLHMGLLTGFVFLVLRRAIALIPWLALRIDGRKAAAVVALAAAAGYLALSGGSVATQRAFVMAAVMLGAVLLDRRALTLRAVALAAVLILAARPEALLGAGFQMSFAATAALVWVFQMMRAAPFWPGPKLLRPVLALVLSSAVAGAATAPVGAAQFNQIAQWGLLANLVSVPVMGSLVMPAAVLAACLAPFGLAQPALWAMGLGCRWILGVAGQVSALEGAVVPVVSPGPAVLPLIALGGLWVFLWQGRLRWSGLAVLALGFWLWSQSSRPALLIAESGGLVGVLEPGGRVLNKSSGDGYAARAWLENDGDRRLPEVAARPGAAGFEAALPGLRLRQLSAAQLKALADPCAGADLVVTVKPVAAADCLVLDPPRLAASGAVAVWTGPEGPRAVTAMERAGRRPWVPEPDDGRFAVILPAPVRIAAGEGR
ncbi:ComEC/Rec2 family competence protein [Poseidonocella sp. HB161398]|uniref:ComEC/Rec2 family competence protein n=1 Tax=Poseidonocella sp. HB161398 TaxID=2320855 RepID=UPI001F0D11D5|nr:ComEC/Rec2 family competence protein [Poseidonocella sp. HB161398]